MAKKYHPKVRKRRRKHGFRVRMRRVGGRRILARRRKKARAQLTVK